MSNALAVLAAVAAVGGDLAAAGLALADLGGLKGRGAAADGRERRRGAADRRRLQRQSASMAATLKVLGAEEVAGRRIAVLGAMRELGRTATNSTPRSPRRSSPRVDEAILVGAEMEALAKALGRSIKLAHVPDTAAAIELARRRSGGRRRTRQGFNSIGLAALVEALAGRKS